MQPLVWARIAFSPHADAVRRQMDQTHRDRLDRVITVIQQSPEDGDIYGTMTDGTRLRQKTGADTHVIYAVKYWPVGRVLLIVFIEIRDWEPLDDSNIRERRRGRS